MSMKNFFDNIDILFIVEKLWKKIFNDNIFENDGWNYYWLIIHLLNEKWKGLVPLLQKRTVYSRLWDLSLKNSLGKIVMGNFI